jgi:hypothetical protein
MLLFSAIFPDGSAWKPKCGILWRLYIQSFHPPRYDEGFKRNAVELPQSGQRSAVQLGRELSFGLFLGKWKRQYGRQGRVAGGGLGFIWTRKWIFIPSVCWAGGLSTFLASWVVHEAFERMRKR